MLYFFHSTKHSKISKPNKGETSIQQLKTFSPKEIIYIQENGHCKLIYKTVFMCSALSNEVAICLTNT